MQHWFYDQPNTEPETWVDPATGIQWTYFTVSGGVTLCGASNVFGASPSHRPSTAFA